MNLSRAAKQIDNALRMTIDRMSKKEGVKPEDLTIMAKLENEDSNPIFHLLHKGLFLRKVNLSEMADFGRIPLKVKVIAIRRAVKDLYQGAKKWLKVKKSDRISITIHLSKELGQLILGHRVDGKPSRNLILYDSLLGGQQAMSQLN